MDAASTIAVGIDVSKDALDCCLLAPGGAARVRRFPNAPAGFAALVGWSVARAVRWLEREAGRVRAAADAAVAASARLAADRQLLESVPGVGRQTATALLAELPPVERLPSAQSAAAYCGLAPREF